MEIYTSIQFHPVRQVTAIPIIVTTPNYTINKTLATIDNMTIDIVNLIIYIGTISMNVLTSAQLVTQYTGTDGQSAYFSKAGILIAGVTAEMERTIVFNAYISVVEQQVNSGLRYISELKGMGLYN